VLTLPLCGVLKNENPDCKISFLGNSYTEPIIALSKNVDAFYNWDEVKTKSAKEQAAFLKEINADCIVHVFPRREIAKAAKTAKIKTRIGTNSRLYHWFTCNRLVSLHRKNSDLHEAQLNILLAASLIKTSHIPVNDLKNYYGVVSFPNSFNHNTCALIDKRKFNLIIHPKSKGSAREWGLERYAELIKFLPQNDFNIFITGSNDEKKLLGDWLKNLPPNVHDVTGQFTLVEFIQFINKCDGLVAASTGPLHITAMLGKKAVGLYAPMRPIFPQRWKPIGFHADYLVVEKNCTDCKKNPTTCRCIKNIEVAAVAEKLQSSL
jgi:ADP-heptose:LPS heptosyltransferase